LALLSLLFFLFFFKDQWSAPEHNCTIM